MSTYEALTVDIADHIAQVTLIGPGKVDRRAVQRLF